MMQRVNRLRGAVQHYDWGGFEFIPQFLGIDNAPRQPYAEWWLGAHPLGEAILDTEQGPVGLAEWIAADPVAVLGAEVADRFGGQLPFLLKILDVRKMLSIQVHPTKAEAEAGFAREEALGVPRNAPTRLYRDSNHKPEMMVALTDFWLLHGFRPLSEVGFTLRQVPGWASLELALARAGVPGLYRHVMEMPQEEVNAYLSPLYQQLSIDASTDRLHRDAPGFWAWQAFRDYSRQGQFDRGIFSIYWFNLVRLRPGEGIFQDAGVPHAYLYGANVELMANSDNVLRGGLTPKHVDVPELLARVHAEPFTPRILAPDTDAEGRTHYPAPVADFALHRLTLQPGQHSAQTAQGPAVGWVAKGAVAIAGTTYVAGQAFFAGHGFAGVLQADDTEGAVVFWAGMPSA